MAANVMKLRLLPGLMMVVPGGAGEEKAEEAKKVGPVFTMRPIGRVQNVKGKPVTLRPPPFTCSVFRIS